MWREIISSFLYIAIELTVLFVLITFLVSIIQSVVPFHKMEKWLNKGNTLLSALFAVLFAFITPFCSCSTIPMVVTLLRKKVPFGIVMVFLFASPVLDPTILTIMTAMLGWKVALIYTLTTTVLSILIGLSLEKLGFEKQLKNVLLKNYQPENKGLNLKQSVAETLTLIKTVYPFLLIGAAIGAIIHGAVPTSFITQYLGGDNWWLVPVAAIIGIPLYIRLSTMIPISQMMIAKGMALGPVMALLISSAGASLPEVALLNSIFKKKLVAAFVISVISMSTISGFLFYLI
ncbi:permease [Sutcliffiella horikoshii]|uniref:Permease n=1 Tax=Sutcliffiella horikoshii TaxID=79883 RepID=A0A1Y0CPL3_9BACI|nr:MULTISPECIES: permease [Bacillaceae]ART77273.1 permease [Sutcliffiella horikoshii]TYS74189.1 permease [Sutcliffiella horikoshii]